MSNYKFCVIVRKNYQSHYGIQVAIELDAKTNTIRPENFNKQVGNRLYINWGNSAAKFPGNMEIASKAAFLNHPLAVSAACNKMKTFNRLCGIVPMVPCTIHREEAEQWHGIVYCRSLLNSSQGKGIMVIDNHAGDKLPEAKMYTQGIIDGIEFRVHVFQDTVVDFMQKKKMSKNKLALNNIQEVNTYIRSHNNGWVFARKDLANPESHEKIKKLAKQAVSNLSLDFGAVDIILTPWDGSVYILEVNTAPGLSNSTLVNYGKVFKAYKAALEAQF